ncbi:MAG: hypothetical protein AAGA69_01060 [Pseudomonadota bacterium]
MWNSINALIFDRNEPHGLNAEFLQNMMAEGAGTVIGITVSVMIAVHLDRQREKSRYRDQRGRAVTRWVKNHTDMVENLRTEFIHGDDEIRRRRRAELVNAASRDARDIRDDYASALDRSVIGPAFEIYEAALHALSVGLTDATILQDTVEDRHHAATDALKVLVQKAGARRAILQTEPIFGEITLRVPLHDAPKDISMADQKPCFAAMPIMRRREPTRRRNWQ